MLRSLKDASARVGRRAALGTCASLSILVGLGFLTTALWIYLSQVLGTLHAAGLIGLIYLGIGLILLGVLSASGKPQGERTIAETPQTEPNAAAAPLVEAFLYGLKAGSQASKARTG